MSEERPIEIDGLDALDPIFVSMDATEALGECFEYAIDFLTEAARVKATDVIGKPVTVQLEVKNGKTREFTGLVAAIAERGHDRDHRMYRLFVRPALWFLTKTARCRIFQKATVPEILKQVFEPYKADLNAFDVDYAGLKESYPPREFVVQYRETDLNFVSRLMEREGIYYGFRHEDGKHTLVLVDTASARTIVDYEEIPYRAPGAQHDAQMEYVSDWSLRRELEPDAYRHADFDFENAKSPLVEGNTRVLVDEVTMGVVFDYPGGFSSWDEGGRYGARRLEELQARRAVGQGTTNARGLSVGYEFDLSDFGEDDQNDTYLVTSATYRLRGKRVASGLGASGTGDEPIFSCSFTAVRPDAPFRPPARAIAPVVRGPQTAIVVGPPDAEIWTDTYGRIQVQFHWDLEKKHSCFVRVAQVWAGSGWGAVHTPRVGQEVIVDFLEGDPDRPIVTGCVYNNTQMPPYEPNKHATRSGIRSHSSPGGSLSNFNEIRFEDAKGAEDLFIQAENTQTTNVKGSQSIGVGGDRTLHVGGTELTTVGKSQTIKVTGDHELTVTAPGGTDPELADLYGTDPGGSIVVAADTSYALKSPLVRVTCDEFSLHSILSALRGSEAISVNAPTVAVDADFGIVHAARKFRVDGPDIGIKSAGQGATDTANLTMVGGKVVIDGPDIGIGGVTATKATISVVGDEIIITGPKTIKIVSGDAEIEIADGNVSVKGTTIKLNC
jgi:type VI secretion system secreted protein VgrG